MKSDYLKNKVHRKAKEKFVKAKNNTIRPKKVKKVLFRQNWAKLYPANSQCFILLNEINCKPKK